MGHVTALGNNTVDAKNKAKSSAEAIIW
jgi:hypothetical protein